MDELAWTEPERWTWQELRAGRVADFTRVRGTPELASSGDGDPARRLRADFLRQLLLSDPHRSELPADGLRVAGAWIAGDLDLTGARLNRAWRVEHCRIDGAVTLTGTRGPDDISLRGTHIAGACTFEDLRIEGGLDLADAEVAGALDLRRAEIARHIRFENAVCGPVALDWATAGGGAYFNGLACAQLTLNNVRLAGSLHLEDATFASAELKRAVVGGHANLTGVRSAGLLDLEGLRVGSDLFLSRADLAGIALVGAQVQGQLGLSNTHCSGTVDLDGVVVGEDVNLRSAVLHTVDGTGVSCAGQLNLDGARFAADVSLQGANVGAELWMEDVIASAGVDLRGSRIGGAAEMGRARIAGTLNLSHATIARNLEMTDVRCSGSLELQGAHIAGEAVLTDATFESGISARNAMIDLILRMVRTTARGTVGLYRARCGAIDLIDARLETVEMRAVTTRGTLNARGARIRTLDLELSRIEGNVFLRDGARFGRVSLVDADVQASVVARRAGFAGKLDLGGVRAAHVWFENGARLRNGANLEHARISQNLKLAGARFAGNLDLTGAQISGMFLLGAPEGAPTWSPRSQLVLSGAFVKAIRPADSPARPALDLWPPHLRLAGLTYERLDSSGAAGNRWLEAWLGRDDHYAPQVYQHVASVLRSQGDPGEADRILYAGRDRQRRKASGLRRVLDEAFRITIGYGIGHRYLRCLPWVIAITVIGGFVFAPTVSRKWPDAGSPWLFSLDQLLPVFGFAPGADDIAELLRGWRHWYLAVHRAFGFLLGSFVLAGLSGVTKK